MRTTKESLITGKSKQVTFASDIEEVIEDDSQVQLMESPPPEISFHAFWVQVHLVLTGSKQELFVRLIKYLLLLRCFVPVPDIIMCMIAFYFVKDPPGYIDPLHNVKFCAVLGMFKLISLGIFIYLNHKISILKQEERMPHTFDLQFVNKLKLSDDLLFFGVMITYFNILMDIEVAIYFRCFGDNCESVTASSTRQDHPFPHAAEDIGSTYSRSRRHFQQHHPSTFHTSRSTCLEYIESQIFKMSLVTVIHTYGH